MTDEEEAKESFNKHITEDSCFFRKAKINIYKYGYLDGLAEGRKEKCLEQNNDGTIRSCEVMKDNEQLKQQIEKMKCCSNCKWFGDCSNDAFQNGYTFSTCSKCNNWELAK